MRFTVSSISLEIFSLSESDVSGRLETGFQLDDTGFVRSDEVGDLFFQVTAAGTQFVVRKRLDRRINGFDFYEIRFYFFAIFVGFGSEKA